MAEPPFQQGEIPSQSAFVLPTTPKRLRHRFAQSPDEEEMWCSSDGENNRRLAQARQDCSVTHRDAHAQMPLRPRDLYTMLPKPLLELRARAMYEASSRTTESHRASTDRLASKVTVATDMKYLPVSPNQRSFERSGRATFDCRLRTDATDARFMASVITNICERIPVALSEIDHELADFLISTSERHAGITIHDLPEVEVRLPSGLPARVESPVFVEYHSTVPDATPHGHLTIPDTLQMVSRSLSIPFSYTPDGQVTVAPSALLLPDEPTLPSEASVGATKDVMRRAIRIMHWMQSHMDQKVFATEADADRFVNFLTQLSCPAAVPLRSSAGHGKLFGGEEPFDVTRVTDGRGFRIAPRAAVQADFGDALPKIVLPYSRMSLRRVIERLDTVFLATGRFEDGWEAACHRADFELELVSEEGDECLESLDHPRCRCLSEERPNTVHRCENWKCLKKVLCETQYQSVTEASVDRIRCVECRSTQRLGR